MPSLAPSSQPRSAPPGASPKQAHATRFARIDVLRALAALSVVAYHFLGAKIGWHLPWTDDGLARLPDDARLSVPLAMLSYGWLGVPLFFALSGFCIHGAFLRQPVFSAGVFFWRRFWRIYPPFLGALALFLFWPMPLPEGVSRWSSLVEHVTTIFTLAPGSFWSPFNPSFWSVAVEFQCYALYPLFLLLRSRFGISRAALGWYLAAMVGSLACCAITGWPDHAINYASCVSFFSFGSWALGALVAEDLTTDRDRWLYRPSTLALALLALALSTLSRPSVTLSFPLAGLVGSLFIVAYAHRTRPINRLEALLVPVGVASYSLYLWHQPLLGPLENLGRELASGLPLNAARVATGLIIAAGLALITFASYRLLERPAMQIASRRRPSPSRS